MSTNQQSAFGPHTELVQLAADLMSEVSEPELWLPRYDAALESGNDQSLVEFCWSAWRSLRERLQQLAAPLEIGPSRPAAQDEPERARNAA